MKNKLLTKKQVAERWACSTRTIDRYRAAGLLTKAIVRFGPRSVRFKESEVDKVVEGGIRLPT